MNVLLVRAGALGDVLLLRRAVAALRSAGHRVRLMAPAASGAALVGPGAGEVEELLPWDGPDAAALLAGEPRRGPMLAALAAADLVVALTRSADVARALARVAPRVVAHDPTPPPGGGHASHWLARPLAALGLDPRAEPPPLSFTRAEREEADRALRGVPPGFLAIHPGSGSPAKNWPAAMFLALAARASGERRYLLALGPAELERGIAESVPPSPVVARSWPVRVLGAALARAGLFVGNDSGASHLAAAAGAPTLALFGPTDPAVWSPVGPRTRCLRSVPLDSLAVDDVLREAEALRVTSAASGPPSG